MTRTGSKSRRFVRRLRLPLVAALIGLFDMPAQAQRIQNAIANFAALDKVTAAVRQLPIELNKTGEFRTLKITPRACYTSDPKEAPKTSTFVEVDEIMFDGKERRIFTGWMFAESPGLNPLVHPVFDVLADGLLAGARGAFAQGVDAVRQGAAYRRHAVAAPPPAAALTAARPATPPRRISPEPARGVRRGAWRKSRRRAPRPARVACETPGAPPRRPRTASGDR